jgi:hypothetical protein
MRFRAPALALIIFAAVIFAAMSGTAQASDIYKWVDAEGNTHFGDRPAGVAGEERLDIVSRPTDPDTVQQEMQKVHDWEDAKTQAAEEAPKGPTREELAADAADRQQKCSMYTQRLQTFIEKRHLYRQNDNGERYYLSEDEMKSARDGARVQIAEYCN